VITCDGGGIPQPFLWDYFFQNQLAEISGESLLKRKGIRGFGASKEGAKGDVNMRESR
jgi:hypothetical protein